MCLSAYDAPGTVLGTGVKVYMSVLFLLREIAKNQTETYLYISGGRE